MRTFLALILLLAVGAGAAQADSVFGVAWAPSVPTGDTNAFAPGLSLRGVSLEMRSFINPTVAWGGSIGWNVFNESLSGTESFGDVTVTGKAWRYINAVPIHLGIFKYSNASRRDSRFFFGLNAGTNWIERRTDFSLIQQTEQNFHLALAPEVGVQMPWNAFLGYMAVRFHHAFKAGEVDAQNWFEFKIGFGLD